MQKNMEASKLSIIEGFGLEGIKGIVYRYDYMGLAQDFSRDPLPPKAQGPEHLHQTLNPQHQILNSSFHFLFHYPYIYPIYYSSFHVLFHYPYIQPYKGQQVAPGPLR